MRLTFLCHAATAATRQAAFPADDLPAPEALADARAILPRLGRFDRVLCSPATRARLTVEALGLAGEVRDGLRELDYGRWTGESVETVAAREPEALAAWRRDAGSTTHGGESRTMLFERVAGFLGEIRGGESQNILAVTHAGTIRAAIAIVLGAPPEAFWNIDVEPLATLVIRGESGAWRLRALRNPRDRGAGRAKEAR